MNVEEKRAVLEAAGWVLYGPGECEALRPLYNIADFRTGYHFLPPSNLGKSWRDMPSSYGCAIGETHCVEDAYDKFLRGFK
jgi:hypothetical protein